VINDCHARWHARCEGSASAGCGQLQANAVNIADNTQRDQPGAPERLVQSLQGRSKQEGYWVSRCRAGTQGFQVPPWSTAAQTSGCTLCMQDLPATASRHNSATAVVFMCGLIFKRSLVCEASAAEPKGGQAVGVASKAKCPQQITVKLPVSAPLYTQKMQLCRISDVSPWSNAAAPGPVSVTDDVADVVHVAGAMELAAHV
jgi:hypothetical protein